VVLDHRQHNSVAALQVRPTPAGCDQVDRLGCVLGEDDFFGLAGADEAGDLGAGAFHAT